MSFVHWLKGIVDWFKTNQQLRADLKRLRMDYDLLYDTYERQKELIDLQKKNERDWEEVNRRIEELTQQTLGKFNSFKNRN